MKRFKAYTNITNNVFKRRFPFTAGSGFLLILECFCWFFFPTLQVGVVRFSCLSVSSSSPPSPSPPSSPSPSSSSSTPSTSSTTTTLLRCPQLSSALSSAPAHTAPAHTSLLAAITSSSSHFPIGGQKSARSPHSRPQKCKKPLFYNGFCSFLQFFI